jgi:hypothetical protein
MRIGARAVAFLALPQTFAELAVKLCKHWSPFRVPPELYKPGDIPFSRRQ